MSMFNGVSAGEHAQVLPLNHVIPLTGELRREGFVGKYICLCRNRHKYICLCRNRHTAQTNAQREKKEAKTDTKESTEAEEEEKEGDKRVGERLKGVEKKITKQKQSSPQRQRKYLTKQTQWSFKTKLKKTQGVKQKNRHHGVHRG